MHCDDDGLFNSAHWFTLGQGHCAPKTVCTNKVGSSVTHRMMDSETIIRTMENNSM